MRPAARLLVSAALPLLLLAEQVAVDWSGMTQPEPAMAMSSGPAAEPPQASRADREEAKRIVSRGFAKLNEGGTPDAAKHAAAYAIFEQAEAIDPWNADALSQLGRFGLDRLAGLPPGLEQARIEEQTFDRIYRAFSPKASPRPVPFEAPIGHYLAAVARRRAAKFHDYARALSLTLPMAKLARSGKLRDDCARTQLATLIEPYMPSAAAADEMFRTAAAEASALLAQRAPIQVADRAAVGDKLFYLFDQCMLSGFYYSIYHEADIRHGLSTWTKLAQKAFPELDYSAPRLAALPPPSAEPFANRAIRIGFVSAFYTPTSSVLTDFGGMLMRLPRGKFDVTLIALASGATDATGVAFFLRAWAEAPGAPKTSTMVIKHDRDTLADAREMIANLELDILVYLDLTMSGFSTALGMARLAPVQVTTHGHPTTSGISSDVLDYYVSWAAAELPTAHEHYTERLVLLPADEPHLYWSYRASEDSDNLYDSNIEATVLGKSFGVNEWAELTRANFTEVADADAHWYVCMQKPFKLHPRFDEMLAGVLAGDSKARLILHAIDKDAGRATVLQRYKRAGIDLTRVDWLPVLPRTRLLALYHLADVVLDSYYASGCTTTREALEVGALVVTLPAQYLGSRWTAAFYSIIGVDDLIASDTDEYIQIALRMGTQPGARRNVRDRILGGVRGMYHHEPAVGRWAALLEKMASTPPPPMDQIKGARDHHLVIYYSYLYSNQ